jgi:hypothetical protein
MRLKWCLSFIVCLAWIGYAAADPPRTFWQRLCTPVCPSLGCCPDDYVHKPVPAIGPIPRCGGPDDYCGKPIPCVPLMRCGGPDDYCRKPLPCLLCPPVTPYLQCLPCTPLLARPANALP